MNWLDNKQELGEEDAIFVDNSLLFGSFAICRERGRLSGALHLRPNRGAPALDFGSAIHAGVAELGNNHADIETAHLAFVAKVRELGADLPIDIMDMEKRSIERGLNLISAYQTRWNNEPFVTLRWGPDSKPLTEVRFRLELFTSKDGRPVILCGMIDRMAVSQLNGRIVNIETKTTGKPLSLHALEVRPNHQITTYLHAAREWLGVEVDETVWDAIYVSDRKPTVGKGDEWAQKGIDIEKDFRRTSTSRSERDISEWLFDVKEMARDYCHWLDISGSNYRWPRTGNPMTCHIYNGCSYKDICSTNLDPNVIATNYIVKPWQPWKED